jgi:hypothetical protein
MRTQCESRRRTGSITSIEPLETRTMMAGDVVLEWNAIANAEFRGLMPPGRQIRMLAMVHGAVFDAVNSVEGDYKPYLVKVGTPRWTSAEAAAAVAAHDVLVALLPTRQAPLDAALVTSLAAIPDGRAEDAGRRRGPHRGRGDAGEPAGRRGHRRGGLHAGHRPGILAADAAGIRAAPAARSTRP